MKKFVILLSCICVWNTSLPAQNAVAERLKSGKTIYVTFLRPDCKTYADVFQCDQTYKVSIVDGNHWYNEGFHVRRNIVLIHKADTLSSGEPSARNVQDGDIGSFSIFGAGFAYNSKNQFYPVGKPKEILGTVALLEEKRAQTVTDALKSGQLVYATFTRKDCQNYVDVFKCGQSYEVRIILDKYWHGKGYHIRRGETRINDTDTLSNSEPGPRYKGDIGSFSIFGSGFAYNSKNQFYPVGKPRQILGIISLEKEDPEMFLENNGSTRVINYRNAHCCRTISFSLKYWPASLDSNQPPPPPKNETVVLRPHGRCLRMIQEGTSVEKGNTIFLN